MWADMTCQFQLRGLKTNVWFFSLSLLLPEDSCSRCYSYKMMPHCQVRFIDNEGDRAPEQEQEPFLSFLLSFSSLCPPSFYPFLIPSGSGIRIDWVQIQAPPFISCVTLEKLLDISEPVFLIWEMGIVRFPIKIISHQIVLRITFKYIQKT